MSECIVKGCLNRKEHGEFVGDMCLPCYITITTGEVRYGKTFIHEMRDKLRDGKFVALSAEKMDLQARVEELEEIKMRYFILQEVIDKELPDWQMERIFELFKQAKAEGGSDGTL